MQLHVTVEDGEVRAMLGKLTGRMANPTPAMRIIGEIVRTSIERNFEAGGRPVKWPLSGRVKSEGGQTLTDKAILRRSFTVRGYRDRAEVGTNVKYAAIHQLGGVIKAKNKPYLRFKIGKQWIAKKEIVIPARPFMMVQDDDWPKMTQALGKFFIEGTV